MLISGEAGIGKSRFAEQFAAHIADEPHIQLGCQCSPYHTASPFHPIIEHLKRAAGLDPGDPPDRQLDKLEAMIALATPRVGEVAPLLAAMLSLPSGDRYPPLGLSAVERRQQTLRALVDQLEGLASQKPVLLLVEDVHWADPSTLEVLGLLAERVNRLPILTLVTSRPEFEARAAGLVNASLVTLGRLGQVQALAMVEQVTGGKTLPSQVSAQIVAKADGVPLFVEELTKTVLEFGLLVEESGRYRLDGPLPPLAIPATLHDALMARLDRLAPVKEIVAIGALIGREFSSTLLSAVAGRDQATLDNALAQLEAADLVFRTGQPPDLRYRFRHALVQDAAYESLLRSRRQVLHQRIASALCERFPVVTETEPEFVAHHFAQAGLIEPAVEWWSKAGEQAAGRSAYVEAISHYDHAIALADTLPDDLDRRRPRLRLQIAYGQTLLTARGHGAMETTAAFTRARELAAAIEDPAERFPVYYGLWSATHSRGEVVSAREIADAFLRDAEGQPNSPEAGIAHRTVGTTCSMEGDLVGACAHFERTLRTYDSKRDQALRYRFGHDQGVAAMFHLAIALWQLGEVGRAGKLANDGLTLAVESHHIPTVVRGYGLKCLFEALRHDPARTMPSAKALCALSREHNLHSSYLPIGTFFYGWACWWAGEKEAGSTAMRQAIDHFQAHNTDALYLHFYRELVAETEAMTERAEAALAMLEQAFEDVARTGLRWFRSELHRGRGEILLSRRPVDFSAAEDAFQAALYEARSQQARSLELRAALSLARLYCASGREQLVPQLVEPVVAMFKEEPQFLEIGHAYRLLDDIRRSPAHH